MNKKVFLQDLGHKDYKETWDYQELLFQQILSHDEYLNYILYIFIPCQLNNKNVISKQLTPSNVNFIDFNEFPFEQGVVRENSKNMER